MKSRYLKSSPHFFTRMKRAFLAILFLLLALAPFVEAPLQGPANIAHVPNPVKSAWFLLWIQELVSHGSALVNLVVILGLAFLALPWLPGRGSHQTEAAWLAREQRLVSAATIAVFCAIITLTIIAAYFRGENWALTGVTYR